MLIATKLYLSHLKKIPIALITGGVAIYSGLAAAQQSPVDEIEEVIVSADFRNTQLMQSTGSISVLVEQTIQERASQHLESILNTVPNVTWSAGGSRSRFIQMRGIGDLEQYSDPKYYPSVGIMLDDLELGDSASAGMLFDTEQVEVLRGPQGVRFGASAHAGMVNIKTKAPTDSFEGSISGGVGNYDSYNLGATISGPLTDQLKGRLAIQQNTGDGYIENRQLAKDNTNGFDELTARAKLQWSPSANSQYDIGVFYFDSDNGYDVWSLDNERITYSDQPGKDKQETLAVTAKGEWVLNSEQTLQAVLTHTDSDLLWSYDADWIADDFCV
uniref:TonB-dependent receptor n=1 Tax=uncultured Oceanicoccus sp. TaxID=1706381 RepID=UPI0030DAB585